MPKIVFFFFKNGSQKILRVKVLGFTKKTVYGMTDRGEFKKDLPGVLSVESDPQGCKAMLYYLVQWPKTYSDHRRTFIVGDFPATHPRCIFSKKEWELRLSQPASPSEHAIIVTGGIWGKDPKGLRSLDLGDAGNGSPLGVRPK